MNFWRWYLQLFKQIPFKGMGSSQHTERIRWINRWPRVEYMGGVLIIAMGIVGSVCTSLWFILLIPVGITVIANGYWREFKR